MTAARVSRQERRESAVLRDRIRDRLANLVEDLLPWYDRVAEARKDRDSAALAERSAAALEQAEAAMFVERRSANDYLGRAYWLAAGAVERRRS